ncbi:hypothetical protein EDB92DRAFT_1407 [Lactarius akahatsu]|uniref:Protein kinase domain-containing protein n=1 Tax=Lactarius akahatsu TaxID=416441 RepID=A0AAD4QHT5_9AGAM|nr:hypothetical protein EDB92DRAFT_1407 [Lactarius akahatsu]
MDKARPPQFTFVMALRKAHITGFAIRAEGQPQHYRPFLLNSLSKICHYIHYLYVMLGPNSTIVIPRSTLSIEFGLGRRCFLFTCSPTPIHIAATLKHPLSGVCYTIRPFVRKFGTGGGTRRNVFAAELAVTGNCSALPPQVCLKYAAGVEAVAALRREELLYRRELAELAGVAVPQTYGFFTGGTMAAPIACLIMELCMSTEKLKNPSEFCRLAMLTLCKVHAAGVMHNTELDLRHFVMKGKQVFLVDFSGALIHPCGNAHPVLYKDAYSRFNDDDHDQSECQELVNVERGIFLQIGERLQ